MNAEKAKTLALAQMQRCGLIDFGWRFAFNATKRALGLCAPAQKTIYLSTYFLDKVSEVETMDTILHEIAHALEAIRFGTSGHGTKWKTICREVGAQPVAKCKAKIHHAYPYVLMYEGAVVKGFWKMPKGISSRLRTLQAPGRPETLGKLRLYSVTYRRAE
jgi:hypothetical protein